MQLDLVPPSRELAESYRGLVGEFVERGEKLIPFTLSFPTDPFPQLVERLEACARGEGIPPGFVPHSTYWLVREKAYVVGVSNLRHALTASLKREIL